jgi:sugar/nucleoside kinase (ribokinase family)
VTEFDVVVLGEPMVERHLSPQSPDSPDSPDSSVAPESVSGDAFNAACAAVLAGARVALLTVLGTDDAGDLVLDAAQLVVAAVARVAGAGDTLLGTLAAGLARGERLADAAPLAVVATGLSTQHRGGAPTATRDQLRTAHAPRTDGAIT